METPLADPSWIDRLSPELFWDVQRGEIRPAEHFRWLVERILTYGRWKDWLLLRDNADMVELILVAGKLRIPERERIFLANQLEGIDAP